MQQGKRDTSRPRVLVIIPAYNEQESIVDVVRSVVAAGYDYIVVNDGSSDATLSICRENGISVLNLPQNLGIGGAVQAGHRFAQTFGYDIDVQFDGDGQHDARFLDAIVALVESGADLAIGSRFLEETGGFTSTFMRRVGKSWLSWCLRHFAHISVSDPTSGFRACGRRAIDLFADNYPIDYPEPESIAVAAGLGLTIRETSVVMHERQGGVSSIGFAASAYYMVKVTLAILIAAMGHTTRRGR